MAQDDQVERVQWTHVSFNGGPRLEIATLPRSGPTFEDVPLELSDKIRTIYRKREIEHSPYFAAAKAVAQYYIGTDFSDEYNCLFFREEASFNQANWQYVFRIMQIGEGIFSLRKHPCFPDLCRRFAKHKNLVTAFYEAFAMNVIAEHGFQIDSRMEQSKKGKDFDFFARRDQAVVNVEVAAFEVDQYREDALRNRIKKKIKQLPADEPSILFCFIPDNWFENTGEGQNSLETLARRLFGNTGRLNYIFFAEEMWLWSTEGQGRFGLNVIPHRNPNARLPSDIIDEAVRASQAAAQRRMANLMFAGFERQIQQMMGFGGPPPLMADRDFFRWVHWALSTPEGTSDTPLTSS